MQIVLREMYSASSFCVSVYFLLSAFFWHSLLTLSICFLLLAFTSEFIFTSCLFVNCVFFSLSCLLNGLMNSSTWGHHLEEYSQIWQDVIELNLVLTLALTLTLTSTLTLTMTLIMTFIMSLAWLFLEESHTKWNKGFLRNVLKNRIILHCYFA